MTDQDRAGRLLESLPWRDPDAAVERAEAWYQQHRVAIAGIKLNQWEAIRRMGETATTFHDYRNAVDRALNKEGKESQPAGKQIQGVGSREQGPERRWKTPELADLLVKEIERAVELDRGERMREFQRHVSALPSSEAERLRQLDRVRAARAFVQALVLRIRSGRTLEKGDR